MPDTTNTTTAGAGRAYRAIDLRSSGAAVTAWLEDDFHHFGIVLRHDGARVTAVEGMAERYPRNTCPGAVSAVQELVGMPLQARCTALGEYTDMRQHCTHLYDLLGLAIAQAAQGRTYRRYDAVVPDRVALPGQEEGVPMTGATAPEVYRDGRRILAWQVEGNEITGPGEYAGISLGRGFRQWTETLDLDHAEAAHVLRRAILIALGRLVDLQALSPQHLQLTTGLCHSFQPDIVATSNPVAGSRRDYADNPAGLLADIQ